MTARDKLLFVVEALQRDPPHGFQIHKDPTSMDTATLFVVVLLGLVLLYNEAVTDGAATFAIDIAAAQPPMSRPIPVPPPPGPIVQPPITTTTSGDGSSEASPIMAMPIAQLAAQVRSTMAYYGRDDDAYWISHADHAGQFSNGRWYIGWNAYWFARAAPNDTGSADPNLAGQPAPV